MLNAPSIQGIDTLDVAVAGCTKVLWQWRFDGIGAGALPVKGFNYFHIIGEGQIKTVYLELNCIAWGIDQGRSCSQVPGSNVIVV